MSISSRLCFYGKFGFSDAALKRFLEYLCFNSFYHSIFTTGCSLDIVFFSRILESLPPRPSQHLAAIGCTKKIPANRSTCTACITLRALKVSYSDVGEGGAAVNWEKTHFFLNTLYELGENKDESYVRNRINLYRWNLIQLRPVNRQWRLQNSKWGWARKIVNAAPEFWQIGVETENSDEAFCLIAIIQST